MIINYSDAFKKKVSEHFQSAEVDDLLKKGSDIIGRILYDSIDKAVGAWIDPQDYVKAFEDAIATDKVDNEELRKFYINATDLIEKRKQYKSWLESPEKDQMLGKTLSDSIDSANGAWIDPQDYVNAYREVDKKRLREFYRIAYKLVERKQLYKDWLKEAGITKEQPEQPEQPEQQGVTRK